MREAVAAGASMVNDVNALAAAGALEAVADSAAAVCLMHKQGDPRTMQANPRYTDVVREVKAFLAQRVRAAEAAGIARERIVVDPGFGFGKSLDHNLELLRRLGEFTGLAGALLVALSRKSLIGTLTGRDTGERLAGSIAAALAAVGRGAQIVRVHDVAATRDALRVWSALAG